VTHYDAELAQLRLIDHFLEGEGDDHVADVGFDNEVDRAIVAVGNSKLHDIRLALDRRNSDARVLSLDYARLRARKPVMN
jgi:hypothetical protein